MLQNSKRRQLWFWAAAKQKQDKCTGMNATEASSSFVVPIAADHPIHNSLGDGPQEPEPPDAFVGWRRRLAV